MDATVIRNDRGSFHHIMTTQIARARERNWSGCILFFSCFEFDCAVLSIFYESEPKANPTYHSIAKHYVICGKRSSKELVCSPGAERACCKVRGDYRSTQGSVSKDSRGVGTVYKEDTL